MTVNSCSGARRLWSTGCFLLSRPDATVRTVTTPQDIEQAFTDAGLSLFPKKLGDLQTECSCPDWSNPCKHIAAVYYLLAEEFDRDPFLLFKLRGMEREELVALLDSGAGETKRKAKSQQPARRQPQASAPPPSEPLGADTTGFWQGGKLPDDLCGEVQIPPVPAALVKRVGSFPFWRGEERFLDAVTRVYTLTSPRGIEVFLGERKLT